MVSSFFKTRSLDVLIPQISTLVCMKTPRFPLFGFSIAKGNFVHAENDHRSFVKS
jgi:hypothetical protein